LACFFFTEAGYYCIRIITLSSFLAGQLVKLDSLALYWNTKDNIGKLPTQEDWVVIVLLLLPYYAVILVIHNVSTGVFTPEDSCFHGNAWFEFQLIKWKAGKYNEIIVLTEFWPKSQNLSPPLCSRLSQLIFR